MRAQRKRKIAPWQFQVLSLTFLSRVRKRLRDKFASVTHSPKDSSQSAFSETLRKTKMNRQACYDRKTVLSTS
eukprot:2027791-Amphidinium_carterae.1